MQCGNQRYQVYPKDHSGLALTSHGTNNGNNSGRYSDSDGNVFVSNYSGLDNQLWEVIPTPPTPEITQQIDVDTLVQDSIDITGGAKYYQFTAQVTGPHTIQFTNIPDFVELHAFLYHSVDGILLTDVYSSTDFSIPYILQQGQVYYIRVIRRWDQGSITEYTLQVNSPQPIITDGVYYVKNVNSQRLLTLHKGEDVNTRNVYEWTDCRYVNQRFRVAYDSAENAYRFYAICSSGGTDKVLDIVKSGDQVISGCNVQIYSPNDPVAQLWYIEPFGSGTFKIVPKSNPTVALTTNGEPLPKNWSDGDTLRGPDGNFNAYVADTSLLVTPTQQNWEFISLTEPPSTAPYENMNWTYMYDGEPNPIVTISSGYKRCGRPDHQGIDLAHSTSQATYGVPVRSVCAGSVKIAGYDSSAGNWVVVESNNDDPISGNRLIVRYMHMQGNLQVVAGNPISAGQLIGYTGNTGDVYPIPNVDGNPPTAGAHLHFDVNRSGHTGGGHIPVTDFINPQIFFPGITFVGRLSSEDIQQ